jgi:hypothetical protein
MRMRTAIPALLAALLPALAGAQVPSSAEFHDAALRTADWLAANQVTEWSDANRGRFLATFDPSRETASLTDNWMGGAAVMGLLMAYHRTGDTRYLDAACLGGDYLKTIQIADESVPGHLGAFREITPQTTWCYTRDALTAAWALLWLYHETGDQDALRRVRLFTRWFEQVAMEDGWPLWEVNFRGEAYRNRSLEGSFHGGSGGFFYDLWRVTGDEEALERLRFIADHLCERFISESGEVRVIYDRDAGRFIDGVEDAQFPQVWQRMHRYNDDFSPITLLGAHERFGNDVYLGRAEAFARWLMGEQRPEGGFGDPDVESADATGVIELLDLAAITGNQECAEAARRAGVHLLSLQDQSPDPRARGGFLEMSANPETPHRIVNIRTSAYALIALLKLEGVERGPYYSALGPRGEIGRLTGTD